MSAQSDASQGDTTPQGGATLDTLPPRAAVAMLTLRLRAAEQAAVAAEADEQALDADSAMNELRGRLDAMVRERERVHAAAVAAVQSRADADLAAARTAAAAIAARQAVDAAEPATVTAVAPVTVAPTPSAPPPVGTAAPSAGAGPGTPSDPDPSAAADLSTATSGQAPPSPGDGAAAAASAGAPTVGDPGAAGPTAGAPGDGAGGTPFTNPFAGAERIGVTTGQPGAPQVVVDAEVLGRIFASVFSSMLDERLSAWVRAASGPQALPPASAPARRTSVWKYLRHPDVALLAVATVIVLVVLASWMG